jgi:multimeric flavodoxin WrbA
MNAGVSFIFASFIDEIWGSFIFRQDLQARGKVNRENLVVRIYRSGKRILTLGSFLQLLCKNPSIFVATPTNNRGSRRRRRRKQQKGGPGHLQKGGWEWRE